MVKNSVHIASVLLVMVLAACSATSLKPKDSVLGEASTVEEMMSVASNPGPIMFKKHLAARWAVDRSGLINLNHPKAIAAGLEDGEEPIELYVYTLTHPQFGTFIVDSGISENFRDPDNNGDLAYLVKKAMNTSALKVVETTRAIATAFPTGINGVLLTHIHLDHIMGLSDLPGTTPIYLGPGDTSMSSFMNAFTQGTTDRLLGGNRALNEWQYQQKQGSSIEVVDVFSDGSVWAIHAPGHTPGSTAYLIRSTDGPQLLTGDACHTRWGWVHGVEPGTFSEDQPTSAISLSMLKKLAEKIPGVVVHPGHQSF